MLVASSPLPRAGKELGERAWRLREATCRDFVEAPALTPGPSPASGRGEQTERYGKPYSLHPRAGSASAFTATELTLFSRPSTLRR